MVLQPLQHHIALQSQQRITKKDKKTKIKAGETYGVIIMPLSIDGLAPKVKEKFYQVNCTDKARWSFTSKKSLLKIWLKSKWFCLKYCIFYNLK